ncbi:DUF4350 domain-containing protein [Methanothermococcus okinawensis]|uniref:DUF4350 domain-containing protein n=1 Tax=Methanothermococcus okinawensis (strain DSM 14208 / JCM 11175 / IH1) TaxID=647113 RepID=F8AK07_METOI|nr:DUF4350 domain-containing protein [Methanothermococcus okinawensis]AEH07367.1 hypothetical protein Metok_1402 [Methanothermococcus okinawensis IH1]
MKIEQYILLMIILIGFISMPLVIPTIKTTQPYSVFNTKDEGCSNFLILMHREGNVKPLIYPYKDTDLKENSVLFIIGPDVDFTKDEGELLKNYVSSGNTLVIADNFNRGNSILKYMNISERFSNKPLYDIIEPIALYNGGYILLKNPTTIKDISNTNGHIIISSSASSNIINYPKPNNEKSYPLMVEKDYGNGKIILISDPNIFTNQLFNTNKKFLKTYFNYSNQHSIVYFDEYHHSDVNPQNIATIVVNSNNITPKFLSYLSIIVLIIVVILESDKLQTILINRIHNIIIDIANMVGNNKLFKYLTEENNNINDIKFYNLDDIAKKYNMDKSTLYKILSKLK